VKKTHDYIHHYRGYWSEGGKCRIRIYREAGRYCRDRPEVLQSESFPRSGRRCKRSNLGSLSLTDDTYAGKHNKRYLAYLCGILGFQDAVQ
jgi:hypothetical protein